MRRLIAAIVAGVAPSVISCSLLVDMGGLTDSAQSPSSDGGAGGSDAAGDLDAGGRRDARQPAACNNPALQAGSPWPMLGGCTTHAGLSARIGPKVTRPPKWSAQLTAAGLGTCGAAVVASNGTIYVGAEDDTRGLQAIAPDGTVSFRVNTFNVSASAAVAADGTVYAGAGQGVVASSADGKVLWRTVFAHEVDTSPAIGPSGAIYVVSTDKVLHALIPDGGVLWTLPAGASSPAVASDGTIIVAGADFNVYGVSAADGKVLWKFRTKGEVRAPALAADGTIYAASADSTLYALHPDGGLVWTFQGAGGALSAPAIGPDGTVYVGSADNTLYAVDSTTGALLQKLPTGGRILGTPTIASDGTIYVESSDGVLYGFAPDGTRKLAYPIGDHCDDFANPALGADGTLYVTANDEAGAGYLLAFAP